MKFDMGNDTLSTLTKQSAGSNDDLGALVKQFVASVAPLEGKFNGAGKAAFDSFKARTDEISADLNNSLAAIVGGQSGMDVAFQTGDSEASDNAQHAISTANFDGARFGAARA